MVILYYVVVTLYYAVVTVYHGVVTLYYVVVTLYYVVLVTVSMNWCFVLRVVQCFDGVWFYRPEETFHVATAKFYQNVSSSHTNKLDFHYWLRTSAFIHFLLLD